jgi:hypothetical protein
MEENPNPLSETEKLAATLAELEAERQKRIKAGAWSRGTLPRLMAVVDPRDGESQEVAQQKALYAHLAEHPEHPKSIAAYDWIVREIIDPKPVVETRPYAPDHADAIDVTPYRPPVPPSPPPSPPCSERSLPPPKGQPDPRNFNIPPAILSAEQRRTRNFNDDTWGNPTGWPIRYPRGNRSGW